MTIIQRLVSLSALSLVAAVVACSGASTSGSDEGSGSSDIVLGGETCNANPPPNARCASACPAGYRVTNGVVSCECCAADSGGGDGGGGEACGGPPPNARCMACPDGLYQQVDGKPTCGCCTADAGAGETCGGPPPNARCMACPADKGYKQIDGKPTCECCT